MPWGAKDLLAVAGTPTTWGAAPFKTQRLDEDAEGFRIVAGRMMHLTDAQARAFYAVHKERPFYKDLVEFMTSGPVVVQVLEGENAIALNRELMGATNPQEAAAGTIRADFAETVDENAVHGSDGPDTAAAEIAFFFPEGVCERTR